MTMPLSQDRRRGIAAAATPEIEPPARPIVTMRWTIDARAGWPVGR